MNAPNPQRDPGRRPSRLASLAPQGDGEGDRSKFSSSGRGGYPSQHPMHRSLSVILRCPANGRASKDERPQLTEGSGPSPFEARTQPSLRRLRRLACVLAPQGDGERASSVPSLTGTKSGRSGTCFPPAHLRDTCRSRTPRRPSWSETPTRRWPRLRRRW